MTLAPYRRFDIPAFLRRIHSPRLLYMPELPRWVDEAAREYDLDPRFLLMIIQKEQSGLTLRTLSLNGLDWFCGFGKTDGREFPQFAGPENQVRSCARGLRRYLTPGDSLYVGEKISKPMKLLDGTAIPATLEEAVLYQYTPHIGALDNPRQIWALWFEEDDPPVSKTKEDLAKTAEAVLAALKQHDPATVGGKTFRRVYYNSAGKVSGMCSMFVRLCFEVTIGATDHAYSIGNGHNPEYFGGSAMETERLLKAAGKQVPVGHRGDIVCFNRNSGANGHIGIVLGGGWFAENTSSTTRGPGTVKSKLADMQGRVTGYYAVLPDGPDESPYRDREITVKIADQAFEGEIKGGVTYLTDWLPVRLLEQVGAKITDHLADKGAVYVYKA